MLQKFRQRHSAFKAVGSCGPWASISSSVKPGAWNPLSLKDPSSLSSVVRWTSSSLGLSFLICQMG